MKQKKQKFRIAMYGQKKIPSRSGGVEVVVEELCTRMVQDGYDVTCYNRKDIAKTKSTDQGFDNNYKGIHIKTLPTIQRRGFAAASSSLFGALFCAFGKYDVVHIHAEGPALFCWIPKLFGKKVICTIHGLDHKRAKWSKWASWYILKGEKNAVRFADEIIVLSANVQEYFKKAYHRDTHFIPNGVNVPQLCEANLITKKWGLEKDSYILFCGRIVPEKGIKYLIEAFKNVKTDKKLIIAGASGDTDDYVTSLKKMAKEDKRIQFIGFVKGKVLDELYSNCYLYVLPSDLEGMPLGLLEAMSYGNCCLTSDIPECAEVIEDKAVTFKKGNVKDLETKIEMLCGDSKKVEKYKKESSDFICSKYVWDKVVKETERLYY